MSLKKADSTTEPFDIDQLKASVRKSVELEEPIFKLRLSISEGLYLLALGDFEGQLLKKSEKVIDYGLIAGGILQLSLKGSISLEKGFIKIISTKQTGHIFLDKVLKNLTEGGGLIEEILRLKNKLKKLHDDLEELLIGRGILKREENTLLWIPLSERMENVNYAYEKEIRNTLRAVVLRGFKNDLSFSILFSLTHDCQLFSEVFGSASEIAEAKNCVKNPNKLAGVDEDLAKILGLISHFFIQELAK
jgi:hypothetical protein